MGTWEIELEFKHKGLGIMTNKNSSFPLQSTTNLGLGTPANIKNKEPTNPYVNMPNKIINL